MAIKYVPTLSADGTGKNLLTFKEKVTDNEAKMVAMKFGFYHHPLKVDNTGKFTKVKIG